MFATKIANPASGSHALTLMALSLLETWIAGCGARVSYFFSLERSLKICLPVAFSGDLTWGPHLENHFSRSGFLRLSPFDILGWIINCCECYSVYCRTFISNTAYKSS